MKRQTTGFEPMRHIFSSAAAFAVPNQVAN